jgi:peroxiredoxin
MGQPIPAFQVEPGQVTRLVLGGTGRPLIGRLAIPDELKAIPERRLFGGLSSRAQTPGRPEIRTVEDGRQREEERRNISRWFGFTPQPDGTFRVEDIPPGDYEIGASCDEQIGEGQVRQSRMVGRVRRMLTVPEIAGGKGHSEEPFDIGTLTLEPFLGVGQAAPEFRVTGLDGKPIRLSDFRGKAVLVLFWGPNQRGGLEESRALRSLLRYKSFTSGERLVILGVSIGASSLEEARAVSSQRGWDWLNAVEDVSPRDGPRVETSDSLRARYNLPYRSSVWLIGPDGKILGRDVPGDAIKAAAATVLRAK